MRAAVGPERLRNYQKLQREARRDTLTALQGMAIDAMHELLADEETTPALRLRTAQAVLSAHTVLEESITFEERLEALEARLGIQEAL